jgi:F0F1-type ATP synthase assembly protein I
MLAVITGLAFIVLGLWGILGWWAEFVKFLQGSVPFMLFVGGLLAVVAGVTSIRDSLESRNASDTEEDKKE